MTRDSDRNVVERGLREGARVEAVNFWLDEGLRIWPIQEGEGPTGKWRVVRVADQAVQEEVMRGTSQECQDAHPDARFGINDNESVPPGRLGTVESVTESGQIWVAWDNGRRLAFTDKDTYRIV